MHLTGSRLSDLMIDMKRFYARHFAAVFMAAFAVAVTGLFSPVAVLSAGAEEVAGAVAEYCVTDSPLAVITAQLPDASAGVAYSQKLQAGGGKPPYTWNISTGFLPAGLSFNEKTGEISGTPKLSGAGRFTVRVTDSRDPAVSVSRVMTVTVRPPVLTIAEAVCPGGTARTSYNYKLQANGGFFPYVWSVSAGSLPAGLILNPATGVISGTPKAAGTAKFTVKVTDSQTPPAAATVNLSIKIEPPTTPNLWFSPIQ